jgi:DivIVA domain-containing protein
MNRLTPLEIQRATFPRRLQGFDPDAVREFLSQLAEQF